MYLYQYYMYKQAVNNCKLYSDFYLDNMTDGIILLFLRTMYTVLENPKKFLLLFFFAISDISIARFCVFTFNILLIFF